MWDAYIIEKDNTTVGITIDDNQGAWINTSFAKKYHDFTQSGVDCSSYPSNCVIKPLLHAKVLRLYVFAVNDIPRGYELLQNYQAKIW